MELVSVIVPVYNVEKYLPECLDSILASTYSNLEIIVVDDGSPDNCPRICDEYAAKDSRIRVIHQDNQGLVGARNTGLHHANGKYVGFVDSDDAISPVMYEQLVHAIEIATVDIAACEYTRFEGMLDRTARNNHDEHLIFNSIEEQISVFTLDPRIRSISKTNGMVWNKLYRKDKISCLFNTEAWFCEDLRFNWDYVSATKCKMVVIPDSLYFYRENDQGIMAEYYQGGLAVEKRIAMANQWKYMVENSFVEDGLKGYMIARMLFVMHGILKHILLAEEEILYETYIKNTRVIMRDNIKYLFEYISIFGRRVFISAFLCGYFYPAWKVMTRNKKLQKAI